MRNNLCEFKWVSKREARPASGSPAFTLIELAVVIAVVLILSALLLPALAGNKMTSWRAECAANLKQMGTALALYTADHNGHFAPATYCLAGVPAAGVTWDTLINHYLGSNAPAAALMANDVPTQYCLPLLWCPADRRPKTDPTSMYVPSWAGARRSYAENGLFTPQYSPDNFNVNGNDLVGTPKHGVGAFVNTTAAATSVTFDSPGWRTSIVQDPAGTIWIAEMPTYKSIQGNNYASFCCGPDYAGGTAQPGGADSACYQLDSTVANLNGQYEYGGDIYRLQGNRFNYLFHDGHVQPLKYTDTIGTRNPAGGTATTANPGGMWTVKKGD